MPRSRPIPLFALAALLLAACSNGRDASLSVHLSYPQGPAAAAFAGGGGSAGPGGAGRAASGGSAAPSYVKQPDNRILIRVLAPHIPTPIEAWFDRSAGRGVISGLPPGDRFVVEVDEYDNSALTLGTRAPLLGRGWAQGVTLGAGESKTVTVPMHDKGTIVRVCGADNVAGGGAGTPGDSGDGGLATDARLAQPYAVKVGPGDEIFVSSATYYRIRKIDRYGYIAHYAGNGPAGALTNGQAAASAPIGVTYEMDFSAAGDLYLVTWDQQIVKVAAASGQIAIKYDALKGIFNPVFNPDLAVADDNTIFYTNAVDNVVYLVQGGTRSAYVIDNASLTPETDPDGALPSSTVIRSPWGVTYDSGGGNLIYCSEDTNRIKLFDLGVERIYTLVGTATPLPYADNIARTNMAPQKPYMVEYDRFGGMRYFFAEQNLNTIKLVRLDVLPNTVWRLAGNGTPGYSGDGGPATAAQLNSPRSVATDSRGNVYIADTLNHAIRMVVGGALP